MEIKNMDKAKAEAFMENMLGIVNDGAIALMVSIGHRTGLFDTLSHMPPSTSREIADKAGLHERYVREWLAAMVTGGILEFNPQTKKYSLPAEHAAFLTRAASPNNLAVTTQFLPLLGSVEDSIIRCFKEGGGVPYSDFPRFHEIMAEESGQTVVGALLEYILPLVPGVTEHLKSGIDVLDIGCGRGRGINLLARTFPKSRFKGCDFSDEAIAAGREEAKRNGSANVTFETKDVTELGDKGKYDLITAFDAIHDQARPDLVLAGIARALKPDGVFLMQDIQGSSEVQKNLNHPIAPFLYTISCMHCMTVSLAEGGMGLGTMWGEELATQMLKKAGFREVKIHQLPHDFQNSYFVCRK